MTEMDQILEKMKKPGKTLTPDEIRGISEDNNSVWQLLFAFSETALEFEVLLPFLDKNIDSAHIKKIESLVPWLRTGRFFFEMLYLRPDIFQDIRERDEEIIGTVVEDDIPGMKEEVIV